MGSVIEKHLPHSNHERERHDVVDHNNHEQTHKKISDQAELARQEQSKANQAKIKELVNKEAEPASKIKVGEIQTNNADQSAESQHFLKRIAYKRTLTKTQQKLPKPIRAFSRLAHNPVIDGVSNVSAKTISRPSGLLSGGVFTFIGSLVLLYYGKRYGFEYNYSVFFILFAGGYTLGIAYEFMIWLIYTRKHRY